eukprot:gnl/TRDRNA2_/TRDRNA2_137620_c2_seq1.p1 gnl/TRDRNA2_/TRDRNA2_137620_c2~~gnl/TRDRNA2_/TRDRNA2_137620_c2_seq1.p1  ORF type:complete len:341 (-),score=81.76 gnl/TRDRNA2_/TRDRNA2_137620_c2_seq1:59-952(-)
MGPTEVLGTLRELLVKSFTAEGFVAMDGDGCDDDGGDANEDEDVDAEAQKEASAGSRGGTSQDSAGWSPHVTLLKHSQAARSGKGKKEAMKHISRAAADIASRAAEHRDDLDFGCAPLLVCELVDMRNTQADGYYEVQGTTVLGDASSAPEPDELTVVEQDSAFAAALDNLVPEGKDGEKMVGSKRVKGVPWRLLVMRDLEMISAEEFEQAIANEELADSERDGEKRVGTLRMAKNRTKVQRVGEDEVNSENVTEKHTTAKNVTGKSPAEKNVTVWTDKKAKKRTVLPRKPRSYRIR